MQSLLQLEPPGVLRFGVTPHCSIPTQNPKLMLPYKQVGAFLSHTEDK